MIGSNRVIICALASAAVVGCSNSESRNRALLDDSNDGEVVIAAALMRSSVAEGPCAPALEVELLSNGSGLRIDSFQSLATGCDIPVDYPFHASYDVTSVEFRAGHKIYQGNSPLGALWLNDSRQAGDGLAWEVSIYDYESGLEPENGWTHYQSSSVNDENLRASGANTLWVRLRLQQPMAMPEVQQMIYSLMLDWDQSHAVENSESGAYDVLIVSDMPVHHIMAQLRSNTSVKFADLR